MLLYILIGLGSLIAILLIIAAIMPRAYTISSSILIDKPREEVFSFVSNLRNQERYSKWVMADPKVELTYTGTDGAVGFIAAWKSDMKEVGVGAQEIISIRPGERYDVELRFEKPFKAVNKAYTTTESRSGNQTLVTTTFEAVTPFPMNLMVPMIKNMLQKDMNLNSANLKKLLESGS